MKSKHLKGFTMVELLVVVAIIGLLATLASSAGVSALKKARDAKRKFELAQIGRFFTGSCFVPSAGVGEYDFADVAEEMLAANPQYRTMIQKIPRDPRGNDEDSRYGYIVTDDGKCAVFANLENRNEPVTLPQLTAPTAGGGTGVLKGAVEGKNGTNVYFEVTK